MCQVVKRQRPRSKSRSECQAFGLLLFPGNDLGLCFSVLERLLLLSVSVEPGFFLPSFLKAFTLNIYPEFYMGMKKRKRVLVPTTVAQRQESFRGMQVPSVSGRLAIPYVGKSSFIINTEAYDSRERPVAFCSCERFCVAVTDGKSCALDPEWKVEAQRAIEASGFWVEKPHLFTLPTGTQTIGSTSILMTPDCLDYYRHVHYKIYIFKAIEYIADASKTGLLAFGSKRDFNAARVESVSIVFNKDSEEGDRLVFTLLKPTEDKALYVAIHKGREEDTLVYLKIKFYDHIEVPRVHSSL